MSDSSAIHSFVSHTFALCREIGRPMVTEVTVNRMIYVTDVYRVTLLFLGIEFPTDLISSVPFLKFWNCDVMFPLIFSTDDYFISVVL